MLFFIFIKDWHSTEGDRLPSRLFSTNFYGGISAFRLFHGNPARVKDSEIKFSNEKETNRFSRIRCPPCKWQPTASSRWFCTDAGFPEYFFGGCGTVWNTFDTGGVCPGCRYRWKWTACLRCGQSSPHEDWYEDDKD